MAQHDYIIANGTGAAVRSDLNNGLAAIVSQNSGATAPATTYAYMTWADTTAGVYKMRNGANNAWITLYQLDGEWSTIAFENGSAAAPSIYFKDSGTDTGIYSPGTDQVAITTGGTGRLFIDASGRLLAGTSTARTNFFGTTLSSLTQIEGTGGSNARGSISVLNNDVSNNPPFVLLGRSGAATLGSNAAVVSGSRLGTVSFHGADGTSFIEAATIAGEVDGTPGSNDMPGRLVLSTTSDGASSPTERLRIDSSGRLLVGTSTASGSALLQVAGDVQVQSINGGPIAGSRNRIINGDMRINQRGGTITSPTASVAYGIDRWRIVRFNDTTGTFTLQQSTTVPAGFTNSGLITVTAAQTSVPSNGLYRFDHLIEGLNTADLGWGAAGAQSITIGFWVRSSITGTYGARVCNSAETRSYVFQYTINAANTFEYKSITIPGDTTGTWLTDTGIGIGLNFDLGSGSSSEGTANAWNASNVCRASSNIRLISNSGATFYITGVQLEPGSVATPFERRSYGQEVALAQRYFLQNVTTASAYNAIFGAFGTCIATTTATLYFSAPVSMRSAPTLAYTGTPRLDDGQSGYTISAMSAGQSNPSTINLNITSAGLTLYRPVKIDGNAGGSIVTLSAEL